LNEQDTTSVQGMGALDRGWAPRGRREEPRIPKAADRLEGLQPIQEGYTILGQAYVKLSRGDHKAELYRQGFDLPYVNRNDFRNRTQTIRPRVFVQVRRGQPLGR
jgi:hypothetical protein